MPSIAVQQAVARLAQSRGTRTEPVVQADIYLLLVSGDLELREDQVAVLEAPSADGTRRRLDIEIGNAVIEVKRDLRLAGVLADAELQLAGYVTLRAQQTAHDYVGIITDGLVWRLYHRMDERLAYVTTFTLDAGPGNSERLSRWLEAILATQSSVTPTPSAIEDRLGASSPAHQLEHAQLAALLTTAVEIPQVRLKRELWAKLLRTAFGRSFVDDDSLFVNHTLLVLSADIIAHAVIGYSVGSLSDLTPAALVRGTTFSGSQIQGVVESDFFDWVLLVDGGARFVNALADRIARFDWTHVEHDVLKALYQSIIPVSARESLGEYYTPDWLAERVVADRVTEPLTQRVLDPGCGSGTFLFHAVRRFLMAAEDAGLSNGEAIQRVTQHVMGMDDVHPVAVTIARVTYLLALGRERLAAEDRGAISIPVYLGDSLQWEQRQDLFGSHDAVRVSTTGDELVDGGTLFNEDLVFPRRVLQDANTFDRLVSGMSQRAATSGTAPVGTTMRPIFRQLGVHPDDEGILLETFDHMRRLHSSGRNSIWGYYVKNLIRPLWLSESENRVDVLIGNPPWLRYSKMTSAMQVRYRVLARERGLLAGGLGAAARELSTLFVARCAQLYLREGGSFAFVMPHGVMTRRPHAAFRSGRWGSVNAGMVQVSFDESWDLSQAPTGFPMVSCVIRASLTSQTPRTLPTSTELWGARFSPADQTWLAVADKFTRLPSSVVALSVDASDDSVYKRRFRSGGILYPRVLVAMDRVDAGPLGVGAGRVAVASRRSGLENLPWRDVTSLHGVVEASFLRRVYLSECILPYRLLPSASFVLPVSDQGMMNSEQLDDHPAMSEWWRGVEALWEQYRVEDETSPLRERLDFHSQLSSQFPPATWRVVYTASGGYLNAALVANDPAVIEHSLYWAAVSSQAEALFIMGILNSREILHRVRPLMALGLLGHRHVDKNVWSLPIPAFDEHDKRHADLVDLAQAASQVAQAVDLGERPHFRSARSRVRAALAADGVLGKLDDLVGEVVPLPAG